MPLYDQVDLLCQAILAEGRQEAERIVQEAKSQADRLEAAERARRQELLERTRREVQARVQHEARNRVDRASLESRRRVAEAKEAALARLFALAGQRLLAFRASPQYRDWLRQMLSMAVRDLGGGSLRIQINPEEADRLSGDLLGAISQETGARLEVVPDPDVPPGGFIAATADGRLRYDATFQGILNRKQDGLRSELAKMLWQT